MTNQSFHDGNPVLGVIPARGGSKGVPGKNTRELLGKPLISRAIEESLKAPGISRLIVSTDSEEIAAIARTVGAEVPFLRPGELARDDTPMIPVLRHAVEELAGKGEEYTTVVCLQPTSPLRTASHIEEAIALFLASEQPARGASVRPLCCVHVPRK